MTSALPVSIRFSDDCFVVDLSPEMSHLQEPLHESLTMLPQLADLVVPARLQLDMTHVKFIGSAFIGLLVTVRKRLAGRGGTFELRNANKYCQTTIRLVGLEKLLPSVTLEP